MDRWVSADETPKAGGQHEREHDDGDALEGGSDLAEPTGAAGAATLWLQVEAAGLGPPDPRRLGDPHPPLLGDEGRGRRLCTGSPRRCGPGLVEGAPELEGQAITVEADSLGVGAHVAPC